MQTDSDPVRKGVDFLEGFVAGVLVSLIFWTFVLSLLLFSG